MEGGGGSTNDGGPIPGLLAGSSKASNPGLWRGSSG